MAKKLTAFEKQFVAARRSGAKAFKFGGKDYSTRLAGGSAKRKYAPTPKAAPTPEARPGRIEVGKVTLKPGTGHGPKTAVASGGVAVPTPTPKPRRPVLGSPENPIPLKGKTVKTYDNVPTPTPKPSRTIENMVAGMAKKGPVPMPVLKHKTPSDASKRPVPMPELKHKPPAKPPQRGTGTFDRMVKAVGTYRSDTGGTVKVAGSLDPSKRK